MSPLLGHSHPSLLHADHHLVPTGASQAFLPGFSWDTAGPGSTHSCHSAGQAAGKDRVAKAGLVGTGGSPWQEGSRLGCNPVLGDTPVGAPTEQSQALHYQSCLWSLGQDLPSHRSFGRCSVVGFRHHVLFISN